jgi:hypothetical protein
LASTPARTIGEAPGETDTPLKKVSEDGIPLWSAVQLSTAIRAFSSASLVAGRIAPGRNANCDAVPRKLESLTAFHDAPWSVER